MQYLKQQRGPGSSGIFRMLTPPILHGKPNPWDGKPFLREIKRGLGTRHLVEARKRRDIILGDIRRAVESIKNGRDSWSKESAYAWRDARDEADSDHRWFIDSTVGDMVEAAPAKRVPKAKVETFLDIYLRRGYPLSDAVTSYLESRSPKNSQGLKHLAETTVLNVHSAIKHLKAFLNDEEDNSCLEHITPAKAREFRDWYLPAIKTGRGSGTMSAKTIDKNITLLKPIWDWANEQGHTAATYTNPWEFKRTIPRSKTKSVREDYTAEELSLLLQATERGTREGDILRLAIATGCRADELAALPANAVRKDGSGFRIGNGKTENAIRYVPVVGAAQQVLKARLDAHSSSGRLFPDWPLRPKIDKAYAVSQWFTRFRREVLGQNLTGD